MKEWTREEAFKIIHDVLADNTDEEVLSDEECQSLANMILDKLDPQI